MLNIGFTELLLIAVLALVFIGPKELPVVLRHIFRWIRQIENFTGEIRQQFRDIAKESGLDDLKTTTIIDLEGRKQQAYDVKDLEQLSAKPPTVEAPRE
jgi:Tat protein translocase TatB subunit